MKLFKALLLATVCAIAVSSPAFAGGKATKSAPAAHSSDWTGFYAGASVGANIYSPSFGDPEDNHSGREEGFDETDAGINGYAGYNFQKDNVVYGAEFSYSLPVTETLSEAGSGVCGSSACSGYAYSSKLKWMGSLRAKAGLLINNDDSMLFGTAGIGKMRVNHKYYDSALYGDNDTTSTAFVWGFGAEHKASENIFVRLEALQYIGKEEGVYASGASEDYSIAPTNSSVNLGFVYKFNKP